jgi:PAS domain S-box-containing protein
MDRAMFETLSGLFSEPMLLVSGSGDVVHANHDAEEFLGARALEGSRLEDLVEDEPGAVCRLLAMFSRSKQGLPGALCFRTNGGEPARVQCIGAVVRPRSRRGPALVAIRLRRRQEAMAAFTALNERISHLNREIEERTRAEASLRDVQARLHLATMAARVGMWEQDVRTGRVAWSDELEAIFGLPPGSFVGTAEAFYERVHAEDRERLRQLVQEAQERGADFEMEYRFLRTDGEERWMLARGRAFADVQGQPERLAGVGIDITDRKRQELSLKQSQEWLDVTQRSANAGSWDWHPGRGMFWSAQFCRVCGVEPGSVVPSMEAWAALVHPDDRERVMANIRRALESRGALDVEFRILHPSKGERWLSALGRTSTGREGEGGAGSLRIAGIVIDVTRRKQAEMASRFLAEAGAELASSLDYETTLRTLAEMAVPRLADWCAVDILDGDGKIRRLAVTHVDPAKVKLAVELQKRWPTNPDARQGVAAVLRTRVPEIVPEITPEMLRQGAEDEEQFRVLMDLGLRSYICAPLVLHGHVLGALTFVSAESGRRYGEDELRIAMELASRAATAIENARLYAAAQSEIAERRRAEAELARQSSIVRTVAENAASCLFWMDAEHRPTYMNPAAERVTGFTLEELRGRSLHETLHYGRADGTPYPEDQCPLVLALSEGRPLRNVEEMLIRKDGTAFPVSMNISPIVQDGEVIGGVLEFRDTSEEKLAEEELRRRAEDLARSNAELQDFAYITSHDLKEPLRGISNVARFLEEDSSDQLDEQGRERLQTLVRLSKRMYSLLDALMENARLGRVPLRLDDCDMNEVAEDAVHSLGRLLEAEHAVVQIGPMPRLRCDRAMAMQLLVNLVTNAVQFNTSDPRRVEIGTLEGGVPGRTAVLYVRDNGIGIAGQHLASIFRMFRRLHHREQYGGGIGFGLTIAKRIVERHGGRIWAESEPGRGTTFYFTLQPGRHDGPTGERDMECKPESVAPSHRPRLLTEDGSAAKGHLLPAS